MPAITSLGIGSGADINSIVTQLVALESRPLVAMRSQATALQTQVSSYGQLSSLFGGLQSAATKLTGTSLWTQSKATSSDETAVSVVGGSTAAAGGYSVSVANLAAHHTVVSNTPYSDATELVGAGTLTLDIGSWETAPAPMDFVPQVGRAPVTVDITATDTLQSLRDKVNASGSGVSASIVTDSSGSRLSLRSSVSGKDNSFRMTVADSDGGLPADGVGLSRFAYDARSGGANMSAAVQGDNARATVNGIAVESATNELSTVIEGLTLRLRKANFGTADVAVASDREAVKTAIQGFADAYNALSKSITDQTKYDATSRVGGPLQGDSAATGLQRQLRDLLNTPSGASTAFARLSDVGLQMQRDGTLSVNASKLDSATANLTELKKAFSNNDTGNAANNGFARRYSNLATQVLGTDGSLTTRSQGLRDRIAKNSDDQGKVELRVERYRARLVAQYTAMDAAVSKLNGLSSYVTAQLNALSNNAGNSR